MKYPHHYGTLGIFLILLAFISWYIPFTNTNLLIFQGFFYLGNILLFDYISYKFRGKSLLTETRLHRKSHFLVLGFLFGIILELYLHWLGKFWYYPYWSPVFYAAIFVPGFAAYAVYLIETYMGIKAVFEHFMHKAREPKVDWDKYKRFFRTLGIIGTLGIGALTTFMVMSMTYHGITDFFSVNYAPSTNPNYIYVFILLSIAFWFFGEYIEYENHETSMLYEMMRGNYYPIVAVFVAGWVSALLYKVLNAPTGLWRYANWPFPTLLVLNIPLLALILWPFHYFPMFSLYRILFKKETNEIWK